MKSVTKYVAAEGVLAPLSTFGNFGFGLGSLA